MLQSDWLRTFWPISLEPKFSQILYLCRTTANNENFHYRTNSVKINDKIFSIFKNPILTHFWPTFPVLGANNFFLGNPALSRTTSYGFLASCQNLEKTNDTIPRKHLDRQDGRMDGRMEGQTEGRTDPIL